MAHHLSLAEELDLLGWAVPGRAFLTFGLALPLAFVDRSWRRRELLA